MVLTVVSGRPDTACVLRTRAWPSPGGNSSPVPSLHRDVTVYATAGDTKTLLALAEKNNVHIPCDCRDGNCGACRTARAVRQAHRPGQFPEPGALLR